MPPELIADRYRVERPIGKGGMGTVWLCQDTMLGRQVAVKQVGLLPGETATDTARALREARNSAALNHRHVVSVFDVAQEGESVWLVMEYVPSRTLSEKLDQDGRLDVDLAASIGAQVADGLAAAHAQGTIHRDVKPSNILLTEDNVAKIGDFGIARGRDDPQLTSTGMVTGTPSYFSPELARGGEPGPEADVWALGATLYAAVEGRPAYVDKGNALAVLQVIAHEPPPKPERAGILAEPLSRMMDPDPTTRWVMADAAQVLRRAAQQTSDWETPTSAMPAAAASPAPRTTRPETAAEAPPHPPRERRGAPAVVLLAAAAILVAAVAGGFWLVGDDDDRRPSAGPSAQSSPSAQTSDPTPSSTPEPTPSPTDTPEPAPETTPPPPPEPEPPGTRAEFLRGFFDTVPGDLDAGWQQLAPEMQAEVGRDSFDGFWGQIAEVDASSVQTGGGVLDATVTYTYESGRVVRQQNRYQLDRSGGEYLIADEEVLSSRTVSE